MSDTLAIFTGSIPPMRCGVGDYAFNLVGEIVAAGHKVYLVTSEECAKKSERTMGVEVAGLVPNWGGFSVFFRFRKIKKELISRGIGYVNIQYPTMGYGYSCGPQLLVILFRFFSKITVVSTIHEFRHAKVLRKISLIPFFLFSHRFVFTAQDELDAVAGFFSLIRYRFRSLCAVIPVGSNIPEGCSESVSRRKGFIVFFGLFYPGRQLEMVAEIYKSISEQSPDCSFAIIGDTHPKHLQYYQNIKIKFESMIPKERMEWYIGKNASDIASILSSASLAILPYPDGASFRRTTLIASLRTGVPVLSNKGDTTPSELQNGINILFASDNSEFVAKALSLLSDSGLASKISSNAKLLGEKFEWKTIALKFLSHVGLKK